MKAIFQFALSVGLGFIGGLLASPRTSYAERPAAEAQERVLRANRFELVDAAGRPVAYWGMNATENDVQLAFLDENSVERFRIGIRPNRRKSETALVYSPFSELTGSDGHVRIGETLDPGDEPVLAMGDGKSEKRILLGHWDSRDLLGQSSEDTRDAWSLVIRDPLRGWRNYVEVGATSPLKKPIRTGYLVLRDSSNRQTVISPNHGPN